MKLFAVKDNVTKTWENPISIRSEEEALRSFKLACEQCDHMFHRSPEDYAIYQLGEYDEKTGVITPSEPQLLASATDYIQ